MKTNFLLSKIITKSYGLINAITAIFMTLLLVACNKDEDNTPTVTNSSEAAGIVQRYIKAVSDENITEINNLFATNVLYSLQFGLNFANGTTTIGSPVEYVGQDAVNYFQNGFNTFGASQNTNIVIDQITDLNVAWLSYRQLVAIPWAEGQFYDNIVVERITVLNGKITKIILYENPDPIRNLPPM
jgi:hypothetical protein